MNGGEGGREARVLSMAGRVKASLGSLTVSLRFILNLKEVQVGQNPNLCI